MRSPHTMQQHLYKKILSSIQSTPQTDSTTGRTTSLGKIKAHINSKGNDIANHLANIVADGQPPDVIYFRGAHTQLGQWKWPYTTQLDEPNPPKSLAYTNLTTNARKYSLTSTITPLHHSAKHGDLLAAAKRNEADFTYQRRHPSLTSTQITHKMEFMWGVHNTRHLPWNKSLKCPMCSPVISNGLMAGNCPCSMSCLRQDRHNSALRLLLTLL
jgi:hypothetical protein